MSRYPHRVTIRSAGSAQDAGGEMVPTWPVFATVFARVEDVSGNQSVLANAVSNPVNTRIRIRYLANVVASMRVDHDGNEYQVESVLGQDKRELQLLCTRLS